MTGHVEVALPLPVPLAFTYRIEGPVPTPGTRVLVPFQRAEKVGWVLGKGDPTGVEGIRDVLGVLEDTPSVSADLLALARWIGEYYIAPTGIAIRAMLPPSLSDGTTEVLRLTARGRDALDPAAGLGKGSAAEPLALDAVEGRSADTVKGRAIGVRQRRLLEAVGARGGEVRSGGLKGVLGRGSIWPEVGSLVAAGLLEHETLPLPEPPVRRRQVVRVTDWLPDLALRAERFGRARKQLECFELLLSIGGAAELADLEKERGFSRAVVHGLEERGVAVVEDEEVVRDPFFGPAGERPADPPLTERQAAALEALLPAVGATGPTPPFLLHGVTGSGKTLVYIKLLEEVVVKRGRSAIVLVPEIALTPQTVGRFRAWFGDEVAVLHSGLSDGERFDQWRLIRRGERRVVVGARSAVFAPVPNLGAVVVDEEHDGSYKQSEAPRYHGRDVAVYRAALARAVCVLGSATPSLESWMNVRKGKFRLLSLPERVGGRRLPPVEIVDLRVRAGGARGAGAEGHPGATRPGATRGKGSPASNGARDSEILSPRLVSAVRERLEKGEQCILLLNRRGYSAFVQCRACGGVRECPNCSITLTFHRSRGRLLCHHCRHDEAKPERCSACGADDLSFRGLGTEQVERVVAETFPSARIARMDLDTTSGRWSHHEILGRVERGEVDLLLGTQMIAKGLDFPGITLVGVVNADVGMHLPDFRATERTFQLLSQVAGRAGRGPLGGEVIVQTSLPEHFAIEAVVAHDVLGFVERELNARRDPTYPPHTRLTNVVVSSPDRALAADVAEGAARWVRRALEGAARTGRGGGGARGDDERRGGGAPIELVGPAPSPIERLHRRWRWHFFLRGGGVGEGTRLLTRFAAEYRPPAGDVRVAIDRDPVALL